MLRLGCDPLWVQAGRYYNQQAVRTAHTPGAMAVGADQSTHELLQVLTDAVTTLRDQQHKLSLTHLQASRLQQQGPVMVTAELVEDVERSSLGSRLRRALSKRFGRRRDAGSHSLRTEAK